MANLACCCNCQRTTRHNLVDGDGSHPLCGLCIVVLVGDVERVGTSLNLMVTSRSDVTR